MKLLLLLTFTLNLFANTFELEETFETRDQITKTAGIVALSSVYWGKYLERTHKENITYLKNFYLSLVDQPDLKVWNDFNVDLDVKNNYPKLHAFFEASDNFAKVQVEFNKGEIDLKSYQKSKRLYEKALKQANSQAQKWLLSMNPKYRGNYKLHYGLSKNVKFAGYALGVYTIYAAAETIYLKRHSEHIEFEDGVFEIPGELINEMIEIVVEEF